MNLLLKKRVNEYIKIKEILEEWSINSTTEEIVSYLLDLR